MTPKNGQNAGARIVLLLASIVVVVAGMKAAAPILLPFFLALFLAVLVLPLVRWLRERRVPAAVAIAVSVLAEIAVLGGIVYLTYQAFPELQEARPRYEARLQILVNSWTGQDRDLGIPVES